MLTGIGQAPVVSLDIANPEIATALSILDSVNREVQGEGWHFNSEVKYPFTPDANDEIIIPENVLQLSDNKYENVQEYQTVIRNGKLSTRLAIAIPLGLRVQFFVTWYGCLILRIFPRSFKTTSPNVLPVSLLVAW